jgi:hypothetical protein
MRYGQERLTKRGRKVEQEYFTPGTLNAIKKGGLWKRQTKVPFCNSKGTVEFSLPPAGLTARRYLSTTTV